MASFALEGVVYGGTGKHAAEMSLDEAFISFRAWFICELIFGPLSVLVRTSIALLLFRLHPSKLQKRILYACLIVVYLFNTAYFLSNLLQCSPPSYFWEQFRQVNLSGKCEHARLLPPMAIAHSIIGATSDIIIAILSSCATAQNLMSSTKVSHFNSHNPISGSRSRAIMAKPKRNKTKIIIIIFLSLGSA